MKAEAVGGRPRRGRRLALRVLTVVLLVAVLVSAVAAWFWRELNTPLLLPAGGAVVSVPSGEAFRITSQRLEAAGVIRHGWPLRWWARWQGLDRLVRSGDYRFDQPLSPREVLVQLRSATAALHRVTIPEGSTLNQVAGLLAAVGFGGADQFLCLVRDADMLLRLDLPASGFEGYVFPDTYAFTWSTPSQQIVATMVERFHEQAATLQPRRLEAGMSEDEMVILASLIEKETGAADERPLISAVFHNRLRIGMPLQSDPTTVYGRDVPGPPTAADLAVDSPYSTYRHAGLPPGPICNPGRAALEAAVAPANVPYLYFVARNDGRHEFSRTLEEHNRAVARFQRGGTGHPLTPKTKRDSIGTRRDDG